MKTADFSSEKQCFYRQKLQSIAGMMWKTLNLDYIVLSRFDLRRSFLYATYRKSPAKRHP